VDAAGLSTEAVGSVVGCRPAGEAGQVSLAPSLSHPALTPTRPHPAIPDETLVVHRAARAAEDEGDLIGARRLVRLLPEGAEKWRWRASLDEGLRLGADHPAAAADPGAAAAWWSAPAMRFGLESPRAAQLLALAAAVLQARGVAAPQRHRMAPGCLQDEPALLDAGLCDLGVLPLYLDQMADPLRQALGSLDEWSRQPATIWEVDAVAPGGLVVSDATGLRRTVAAATPRVGDARPATGTLLYGRVVPAPGPVWGFAVRPIPVNRVCARRVLRAVVRCGPVAERIRAVTPLPEPVGPRSRPVEGRAQT
jgi:hypothetical protein